MVQREHEGCGDQGRAPAGAPVPRAAPGQAAARRTPSLMAAASGQAAARRTPSLMAAGSGQAVGSGRRLPAAIDDNGRVDDDRARMLLAAERTRVEGLIAGLRVDRTENRDVEDEQDVDWGDPAQPLTAQGTDDAVAAGLQDRLQAIERAEARLADGTYGRSVRSGAPIPDERLEADPAAELTVEEAGAEPGLL